MNELQRPDGERFVDEPTQAIPPQSSWGELPFDRLCAVRVILQDKARSFRNNPALTKVLKTSLGTLEGFIENSAKAR